TNPTASRRPLQGGIRIAPRPRTRAGRLGWGVTRLLRDALHQLLQMIEPDAAVFPQLADRRPCRAEPRVKDGYQRVSGGEFVLLRRRPSFRFFAEHADPFR